MTTRDKVITRSSGRCEAMVYIPRPSKYQNQLSGVWTRCFRSPVEVHHMLTRARGGLILDGYGETAHLIALCPQHHKIAHGPGGHQSGLMIDGYVTTGTNGRPTYLGSDPRLGHLQSVDLSELPEELPSDQHGERLRGEA